MTLKMSSAFAGFLHLSSLMEGCANENVLFLSVLLSPCSVWLPGCSSPVAAASLAMKFELDEILNWGCKTKSVVGLVSCWCSSSLGASPALPVGA